MMLRLASQATKFNLTLNCIVIDSEIASKDLWGL